MEALSSVLEIAMVAVAGLAIRFLLMLALLAGVVAITLPVVYAAEAVRKLWLKVALQRVGGLRWRAHTYYTPAHEWVRERAGRLRIGIDDLAAHLIGRSEALTLPVAGATLKRGDPLVTLGSGRSQVTVRAPIEGVVTRVNPYIVNHPSAMRTDPYRRGWLVELSAGDEGYREFLHDEPARQWFAEEAARLSHALQQQKSRVKAPDGNGSPAPAAPSVAREQLVQRFLAH